MKVKANKAVQAASRVRQRRASSCQANPTQYNDKRVSKSGKAKQAKKKQTKIKTKHHKINDEDVITSTTNEQRKPKQKHKIEVEMQRKAGAITPFVKLTLQRLDRSGNRPSTSGCSGHPFTMT